MLLWIEYQTTEFCVHITSAKMQDRFSTEHTFKKIKAWFRICHVTECTQPLYWEGSKSVQAQEVKAKEIILSKPLYSPNECTEAKEVLCTEEY